MINTMENNSHNISDEPKKLSFKLLEEITNSFAKEQKVGSGTFAEVYKGVFKDGRVIAVKKFPLSIFNEKFENELKLLRRLNHQNIVELVGFCDEIEEVLWELEGGSKVLARKIHRALCLEFLPNGSLGKFLPEEFPGLSWHIRFQMIKGICEGLKYLHEVPIIHLDLKPDNILLDEMMVPKIADFGLSRLVGDIETKPTKTPLGTPGFLPPEYIDKKIISKEFDIFSLGVTIKRIVAGVMDYWSIADMDDRECIEHVHNYWNKRLQEIPGYASLEEHCKQVRTCIEIAVGCMVANRRKRPPMKYIVGTLNARSQIEQLLDGQSISMEQIKAISEGLPQEASSPEPNLDAAYFSMSGASSPEPADFYCRMPLVEDYSCSLIPYDGTNSSSGRTTKEPHMKNYSPRPALACELPFEFLRDITDSFSAERKYSGDAFGTVYKGLLLSGEEIAVKRLHGDFQLTADRLYENEVDSLMGIDHINIVQLFGFCYREEQKVVEHNGRFFIVDVVNCFLCYEYVPNGSLDKHLFGESSRLDWNIRFKIIMGICQGLRFLHEELDRPIIHMNLAPENILLDENMVPKLSQFFLSRHFGQEQAGMVTHNVAGICGYLAPEYLSGGEISTKTDIYSLGILIMEIATGEQNSRHNQDEAGRNFIENVWQMHMTVRQNWTDEYIASKHPSLDDDLLEHMKTCIDTGLKCVETDREERPSIGEIVRRLLGRRAGSMFDEATTSSSPSSRSRFIDSLRRESSSHREPM